MSDNEETVVVKDSNGNVLQDGDTIALIKDLPPIKGQKFKRGDKFQIRLVEDDDVHVLAKGGTYIRTEFVKKLNK